MNKVNGVNNFFFERDLIESLFKSWDSIDTF